MLCLAGLLFNINQIYTTTAVDIVTFTYSAIAEALIVKCVDKQTPDFACYK